MAFLVEVMPRAEADLIDIATYIRIASIPRSMTWFAGLQKKLFSLEAFPGRGTTLVRHPNCRQLLYGTYPHTYRILYRVDKPTQTVFILHVRHGARTGDGI